MIELGIVGISRVTEKDMCRVNDLAETLKQKGKLMTKARKNLKLSTSLMQPLVRKTDLIDRFNHTRTNQPKPTLHKPTKVKACLIRAYQGNPFSKSVIQEQDLCTATDTSFLRHMAKRPKEDEKKYQSDRKRTSIQIPKSALYISNNADSRKVNENFTRKDFHRLQRYIILKSLIVGCIKDDVMKHREHYYLDLRQLNSTSEQLDKIRLSLETFISESHGESVKIVEDQLTLGKQRLKKLMEIEKERGKLTVLKNDIFKMDSALHKITASRDILLALSPANFRKDYKNLAAEYLKKNRYGERVMENYRNYNNHHSDRRDDIFLTEAVYAFRNWVSNIGPPLIYFQSTSEVENKLMIIELACFTSFKRLSLLRRVHEELKVLEQQGSSYYQIETSSIENEIERARSDFVENRQRTAGLSDTTKMEVVTKLKHSCSNDILLETIALVEMLHSDMFGTSNQKFSVLEMMNQIEEEVTNVHLTLKRLDRRRYSYYGRRFGPNTKKAAMCPYVASRKYRETVGLIKRVRTLFDRPVGVRKWKPLQKRSEIPRDSPKKVNKQPVEEKNRFTHHMLTGICDNEETEGDLEYSLKMFVKPEVPPENVSVKSEDPVVQRLKDQLLLATSMWEIDKSDEIQPPSANRISVVELGYDSEEDLITKSAQRISNDLKPRYAQYLTTSLDDRFMARVGDKRVAKRKPLTKRFTECKTRFNPLAWR